MTNTDVLRNKIDSLGMSITFVAQSIEVTREGFYNKLNNGTEFKASEIVKLKKLLRLTDRERDIIFFAKESE